MGSPSNRHQSDHPPFRYLQWAQSRPRRTASLCRRPYWGELSDVCRKFEHDRVQTISKDSNGAPSTFIKLLIGRDFLDYPGAVSSSRGCWYWFIGPSCDWGALAADECPMEPTRHDAMKDLNGSQQEDPISQPIQTSHSRSPIRD